MPRKPHLPHLRLFTDGQLWLWRGHLLGWKHAGQITDGKIEWRRTSWPAEFGKYIPK